MSYLSKDDILKASDLRTEEVNVPEWGGTVRVRSLTGAERDRYEQEVAQSRADDENAPVENVRARLVAYSMVDKSGSQLFAADNGRMSQVVQRLGQKNAAALDRVFDVARRLSGLSQDDVEELEGNSESGQNGDSTSA